MIAKRKKFAKLEKEINGRAYKYKIFNKLFDDGFNTFYFAKGTYKYETTRVVLRIKRKAAIYFGLGDLEYNNATPPWRKALKMCKELLYVKNRSRWI